MITPFCEPLGWTLLHFLWQGTAIALCYGVLLLCFCHSVRVRYAIGLGAMLCMAIAFAATLIYEVSSGLRQGSGNAGLSERPARQQAEAPQILPLVIPAVGGAPADHKPKPHALEESVTAGAPGTLSVPPAAAVMPPLLWSERLRGFLPWIVALWGGGVLLLSMRFTMGWRKVRRIKASGTPPEDPGLLHRFSQLGTRLKIRRPVRLLASASVGVPVLIGWLKPVVLIPVSLLAGLSPAQMEAILAHELAHVRRNDFLINALQCLMEAVLFYHPAVWWIGGHLRSGREHCCDDIAAACCGTPADYARALAALEEWRSDAPPVLGVAASGGSLLERVRRLLGRDDAVAELPGWLFSLGAGALLLVVLPLAWIHAAESQPGATDQSAVAGAKPQAENEQGSPSTGSAPTPGAAVPGLPLPSDIPDVSDAALSDEVKLGRAIAAADGFFRAGDAAGKMKYLRLDGTSRPAAERHFQKHGARAEDKAHVILSRVQADGSVILAYDLHGRSQFIRATPQDATMLLDWENSTMCQQGAYHVAETEHPAEAFRILAVSRTDDYYNHGFADQARWSCESLRFPGVEGRLFGYVDRTTPDFTMLQERHQQGRSSTLVFTVKFPADGKGENQVEILKVEPVTGAVNEIGKAAPSYHGQKEIRTVGTVQLSPRLIVKVTSDPDEGTLRNMLEIEGTDDAGKMITDAAALPYGTDTWALLMEEPSPPDGSCIVSIGSRWGVRRFEFVSEKQRARFSKPGFDSESRWYASEKQFVTGALPQFANAAVVDWWENRVRHILKVETPRDQPGLEVRLVCGETELLTRKGPEVPQMILPSSPLGPSRLAQFIKLGPRLLGSEDLEYGGIFVVSSVKELTIIREASRQAFKALCAPYGDRQAAVISSGEVIGTFKLEPDGIDSFWTYRRPAFARQSASASVSAKPVASGGAAHLIAVQGTDGKAIPAFRVIAGVRSSVSGDFEKQHHCSVVNWQSHLLREGRDGKLEWPVSGRSYDEMVLRVEADGYVPQMTGWLKKVDGAQEITFQLAPDPGIRGSVQTHGGGRWAHDATVVLGMIRREIRIKGATFPELDPGPEPKTLRDQWDRPRVFQPDGEGRFTLPDEVDPTAVVLILHGDGVYLKPYAEWRKSPHVQLEPWARINGRVRWGQRVGVGETVDLSISLGDDWGWPDIISQRDSGTADKDGAFVFQRLIPGVTAQLSSPLKIKDDQGAELTIYESARITHVKTGSPSGSAMLGGRGRLVTGQLQGRASWDGVTFHLHPKAPHMGFAGDDAIWKAWTALQQGPDGPLFFRSGLKVAADGRFRIEGLLPGDYQLFFTGPDGRESVANTRIQVPPEDRDDAEPAPYDAGPLMAR